MFARTKLGDVLVREKKKKKKDAPVALASGEGALWTDCSTTFLDTVGTGENSATFEFEAPALCTGQCNAPSPSCRSQVCLLSPVCPLFPLYVLFLCLFYTDDP